MQYYCCQSMNIPCKVEEPSCLVHRELPPDTQGVQGHSEVVARLGWKGEGWHSYTLVHLCSAELF